MPKSSSYAIAADVCVRPVRPAKRSLERIGRVAEIRNSDDLYLQLESFLDAWRREGTDEKVVRAALKRAEAASLAMENVGRRLQGR